jgi:hypothetical protein
MAPNQNPGEKGRSLLPLLKLTFVKFILRFLCFHAGEFPIDLNLTGADIKSTKTMETSKMSVMPAEERHP